MDTQWFAVDAEGRVGIFDTGEDGALPNAAANLGGPAEPNFDVLVLHAAALARARGASWRKREAEPPKEKTRLLVVKAPPGLDAAQFEEIASSPLWVGLSREPVQYSKLEGRDQFTAVMTADELWGDFYEGDEGATPPAYFQFHRDHGDDPGRYELAEAPATPLLVDTLPKTAREAIGAFRLPLDFAATKEVHLADHIKDSDASYWGDWTLRGFGDPNAAPPPSTRPLKQPTNWPLLIIVVLVMLALLLLVRR